MPQFYHLHRTLCTFALKMAWDIKLKVDAFFGIQNYFSLPLHKSKPAAGFFYNIRNLLLVWNYATKQAPVIDNSVVQLLVLQMVWTIKGHTTIYDLIANT